MGHRISGVLFLCAGVRAHPAADLLFDRFIDTITPMSAATPDKISNSHSPPRYDFYFLAVVVRSLQGIAVGCVFVTAAQVGQMGDMSAVTMSSVVVSAAVCGTAIGTAFDKLIQRRFGHVLATAFLTAMLGCGFLSGVLLRTDFFLLPGTLLLGVGIGTNWSSVASLTRQSLPFRGRWKGMRVWVTAFAGGLVIVMSTAHLWSYLPVAASLSGILLLTFCFISAEEKTTDNSAMKSAATPLQSGDTASVSNHRDADVTVTSGGSDELENDCDATECCGGSTQEIRPTSFRHGILIATIGLLTFFGPLRTLLVSSTAADSFSAAASGSLGFLAGIWLLYSVAPRTGYVISILPFVVLGLPAVVSFEFAAVDSASWTVSAAFFGLAVGGISVGCSALVGELFSDCESDPIRTRVLVMSLFASSALIIVATMVREILSPSPALVCFVKCALFVAVFLIIRAIPTPVTSSAGQDDDSEETKSELQDVIAAISD